MGISVMGTKGKNGENKLDMRKRIRRQERYLNILLGVDAFGMGQSSGFTSHASANRFRAASVTERSRDLGMNMFILVLRFCTKVVVFSIAAAVDIKFRQAMRVGIKYA